MRIIPRSDPETRFTGNLWALHDFIDLCILNCMLWYCVHKCRNAGHSLDPIMFSHFYVNAVLIHNIHFTVIAVVISSSPLVVRWYQRCI